VQQRPGDSLQFFI
jgi:hypothetical protein